MKVLKETGERILIRNNEVKEDSFFTHDFSYKNCLLCSDKYYTINNNNNFFYEENEYNPLFKNYIDTASIVGNMINKNNIYIYRYLKIKYIFYITLLLSKFFEGYC